MVRKGDSCTILTRSQHGHASRQKKRNQIVFNMLCRRSPFVFFFFPVLFSSSKNKQTHILVSAGGVERFWMADLTGFVSFNTRQISPCPAAGKPTLCCASSSCPSPGRSSGGWTRPARYNRTHAHTHKQVFRCQRCILIKLPPFCGEKKKSRLQRDF